MPGKLVIFSGPSGVGKDTVLNRWMDQDPRVCRVVAYTTRTMRAGEVDGVDYRFVTLEEFRSLIADGAFLEFKEVFGNLYGTPLHDMEQLLSQGKIAVLKIDVQGALTAMKLRPDAITIFIMPPSMAELERRIRSRNSDPSDVIERRLRTARDEMALAPEYRHVLINGNVDDLVSQLQALLE